MRGTFDIDPTTDTYRNAPADMARVAHMAHRFVDEDDRAEVIAMLFAPTSRRVQ